MVLAAAAAALAIFAVFQAAFQSGEIAVIKNNILLQKETGWPIVGCAVGIVGSVCLYRLDRRRATIWAVLIVVLGAAIVGATVYQASGARDALEGEQIAGLLVRISLLHSSPAIGLHLAKAAGIIAVVFGLTLAGLSSGQTVIRIDSAEAG